jgi:hypothetical protein
MGRYKMHELLCMYLYSHADIILLAVHQYACAQWMRAVCSVYAALPQVIKNKIRGVNMRGFGYGGEDAYFYACGP